MQTYTPSETAQAVLKNYSAEVRSDSDLMMVLIAEQLKALAIISDQLNEIYLQSGNVGNEITNAVRMKS